MARWEGGRGTLKYEVLPEPFKAAAEKRRPAGSSSSSTARDSLPETALEGTKSAGKLKLGEIALRAIESTESYTHYSWTAKITNNMAEVRRVRTYAVLLDGKAFKLDEAYSDDETIAPGAVVILSGKSLVKTPIWKQVKSYTVEVRE